METCLVSPCNNPPRRRGYCNAHYQRLLKYGDPEAGQRLRRQRDAECDVKGCSHPVKARGMCSAHYWRATHDKPLNAPVPRKSEVKTCSVDECEMTTSARGLCNKHYRRWRLYGDPTHIPPRPKRGRQKGPGRRWVTNQGYVQIYWPDHPNAHKDGKVLEHHAVMAEHLGRPLESFENVHHKNGVRGDNSIANLELWTVVQPPGRRVADAIEYANQIISLYGGDPSKF